LISGNQCTGFLHTQSSHLPRKPSRLRLGGQEVVFDYEKENFTRVLGVG
jgi:hypothetical protein